MYITSNNLLRSVRKYKNAKTEHYSKSLAGGASLAYATGVVLLALIFFVFELILLFYSVYIALKCTHPGPERVMHLVLAVTFTLPYALVTLTFNNCAKDFLATQSSN